MTHPRRVPKPLQEKSDPLRMGHFVGAKQSDPLRMGLSIFLIFGPKIIRPRPPRCVFARAFLFSFWAITITNSVIIIAILIVIIIVTAHEGASVFARILEQAVVQAMYSMGWGADGHPYVLEFGLVDDWPVIYQTQVLK